MKKFFKPLILLCALLFSCGLRSQIRNTDRELHRDQRAAEQSEKELEEHTEPPCPCLSERIQTKVGSLSFPFEVTTVTVSGQFAYVGVSTQGFHVIDINDKTEPQNIAHLDTAGSVQHIVVSGNTAYIADGTNGLVVVDITEPRSPSVASHLELAGYAEGLALRNDLLVMASGEAGIHLIRVENPRDPELLSTFDTEGEAHSVDFYGSRSVVVADYWPWSERDHDDLLVINIGNPAEPRLTSSVAISAMEVRVRGHTALVSAAHFGFRIHDLRATEENLDGDDYSSYSEETYLHHAVHVEGQEAFVSSGISLVVYEDADPSRRHRSISFPGPVLGLDVQDDFAYVAAGAGGFHIVDLRQSNGSSYDGSLEFEDRARGIQVSENRAYVVTDGSFYIINVSSPQSPSIISQNDDHIGLSALSVLENYALFASEQGLHLFDVSDGSRIVEETTFELDRYVNDLVLTERYAFVVSESGLSRRDGKLSIFAVSRDSPRRMAILSDIDISGTPNSVVLTHDQQIALIASGEGHGEHGALWVISVEDPNQPSILGRIEFPAEAWDMVLRGHYAYVSTSLFSEMTGEIYLLPLTEFHVIDISDPRRLRSVHRTRISGNMAFIESSGPYVFLPLSSTIEIFDIRDPRSPRYFDRIGLGHDIYSAVEEPGLAIASQGCFLCSASHVLDIIRLCQE